MFRARRYSAFTLVEVIVVIAIIGLMLSILSPALNRAKAMARAVSCSSLMRNLTMAHYMYFTEEGDVMPISVNAPAMQPWHTFDYFREQVGLSILAPEYKQRRTVIQEYKPSYPRRFICPSADYALRNSEDQLYALDRSYGLNAHVYYASVGVRVKLMKQTTGRICMADAMDWWFNYWQCDKYSLYGENWLGFSTYGMAAFRHSNKANITYWDGHCERMTQEQLKEKLLFWF